MYCMRKKPSIKDLFRQYELPEWLVKAGKWGLRYKTPIEKGIYWYKFSLFIRERDVAKYGTCISCNRSITVDTCDAGHFAPASNCGLDLLFHPLNVNAECSYCNAFDGMHLIGYAKNLDKRYGAGTAEKLHNMRECYKQKTAYPDGTFPTLKEWKKKDYEEKLRNLTP